VYALAGISRPRPGLAALLPSRASVVHLSEAVSTSLAQKTQPILPHPQHAPPPPTSCPAEPVSARPLARAHLRPLGPWPVVGLPIPRPLTPPVQLDALDLVPAAALAVSSGHTKWGGRRRFGDAEHVGEAHVPRAGLGRPAACQAEVDAPLHVPGADGQADRDLAAVLAMWSVQSELCLRRAERGMADGVDRTWPAWSLTMAAYSAALPPTMLAWNMALFGTGALVMRGAGCTINDLWDMKIDNKVGKSPIAPQLTGRSSAFACLPCIRTPCQQNGQRCAHLLRER